MDKKTSVIKSALYDNDSLIAEDIEFTLPEVTHQMSDIQAMGNMSVPNIGLLDNMELTIKLTGASKVTGSLNQFEKHSLELRYVQQVIESDGTIKQEACKAFLNVIPTKIPSIGVVNGSPSDVEGSYTVIRYRLVVDGEEVLLVDRLANVLKINGTDYYSTITSLLK